MLLCPSLDSYVFVSMLDSCASLKVGRGCRSPPRDVSSSAPSSYRPSASWRPTRVTWSPSSLSPPSSSPSTRWRRWSSKTPSSGQWWRASPSMTIFRYLLVSNHGSIFPHSYMLFHIFVCTVVSFNRIAWLSYMSLT